MSRRHLMEFEDQPWFPDPIRRAMTDYLSMLGNLLERPYSGFVPRLAAAMRAAGTTDLVDLCSGGTGPVITITKMLKQREGLVARALLTDLYPNIERFEQVTARYSDTMSFRADPIDATDVPADIAGFRLLTNAFHHFPPTLGRAILADAYQQRRGIAVYEVLARTPLGVAATLPISASVYVGMPFTRPFTLSRAWMTYVVPVLPFFIGFDGFVSAWRIYSPNELRALVGDIAPDAVATQTANGWTVSTADYRWEITRASYGGPVPATWLIGVPTASAA